MRRFLLLALVLAPLTSATAQSLAPTPPIRAWFGPSVMFATDLDNGIGAGYDLRVTIERPDLVSVSVVLGGYEGTNEERTRHTALYGAMLVGRSFPVAADAFLHLGAGIGYAEATRAAAYTPCNTFDCTYTEPDTNIGGIVPIRAELHVPYRMDRSFGISAQATLFGQTPNRFGLGLHYSFGRNLSGDR